MRKMRVWTSETMKDIMTSVILLERLEREGQFTHAERNKLSFTRETLLGEAIEIMKDSHEGQYGYLLAEVKNIPF